MKTNLLAIFSVCLFSLTITWPLAAQVPYETQQKADQGDPVAQRELGRIYAGSNDSDNAAKNYEKAVDLWQSAAQQGDSAAQRYLGNMFYLGTGVEKRDFTQAFSWYIKAAEGEDGIAQVSVASMYERGLGVSKDAQQALNWYQRAASNGYPEAMSILGSLYFEGTIVERDYDKALHWFSKAAEKGDVIAQQKLALMYHRGLGAVQNNELAYVWIDVASRSLRLEEIIVFKRQLESLLTEAQREQAREMAARRFVEIQTAILNSN